MLDDCLSRPRPEPGKQHRENAAHSGGIDASFSVRLSGLPVRSLSIWVVRSPMSSVLIVNEISTEREEITRALEAEGFTVVQASSAGGAVREIWGGSFLVAIIPTQLSGTTSSSLQQQLSQMAPEIETLIHGKNDELPALVRKVVQIRDGEAAA